MTIRPALLCLALIASIAALAAGDKDLPAPVDRAVDFEKEILPIFEANCVSCHGAARPRSGFRLDSGEHALRGGDYGVAIHPGNSAESPLIHYVAGTEKDMVMPPEGERLSGEQVGLLRAWIDQGAEWPEGAEITSEAATAEVEIPGADHWAFQKPIRHPLPAVKNKEWPTNPIDFFILNRLEEEGLSPSPEADKRTLIRRVTLDLIGLPPTPSEVEAFLADDSRFAYDKLVDRLLASPHFGERWARLWLDSARYADTNGYEKDRPRSIWPYRDWVIDAYNRDLPFDRFAIEQVAGDLLPGDDPGPKIATGFHRNTMVNEEGGADVEEFRYHSIVDRVHTTSTIFLGLTVACAQCHDHKYDPITQREYYEMFAFLNNADEPEMKVPDPEIERERERIQALIAGIEEDLPNRFPPYEPGTDWTPLNPSRFVSTGGATLAKLQDGTILAVGPNPATAIYTLRASMAPGVLDAVRLEAMHEIAFGPRGPSRSEDGNFVLSEFEVSAYPTGATTTLNLEFDSVSADDELEGSESPLAADGDPTTGWAVNIDEKNPKPIRAAVFRLKEPIEFPEGGTLTFRLIQNAGSSKTLEKFRLSAGSDFKLHHAPELPIEEQRAQHLAAKFQGWVEQESPSAREWTALQPVEVTSEHNVTLTLLDDRSVLASGDNPNRDAYTAWFEVDREEATGFRVEVLTHESLPANGPGRGTVMGTGTFMLSEVYLHAVPRGATAGVEGVTIELKNPTADYSQGGRPPEHALDRVRDTGWAIDGAVGKPHWIVFETSGTVNLSKGDRLRLVLLQNYIHQETIGRFRFSISSETRELTANPHPAEIEAILAQPPDDWTDGERGRLQEYYLSLAPELKAEHRRIAELEKSKPQYDVTLVLEEREDPRRTHVHARGEFLRKGRPVDPGAPAVLHPLPEEAPRTRLTFAEWLVDEENPLVGRVTTNRYWDALFTRGLVTTPEDFGTRCDPPSHPELLDWLATEFVRLGWSTKAMLRLMVTSSTYKQSSNATPELLEKDPYNILLARAPRPRIEAEMVRDVALAHAGLLNRKVGGPSVFPPQPAGVSELAWGGWKWKESEGVDRYRRGLYTYLKRASPYPGMTVFDAPAADACVVKRRQSNTPLQALTLLNDEVFLEAARAFGARILEEGPGTDEGRIDWAFEVCFNRQPTDSERTLLLDYIKSQMEHFENGTDAESILGPAGGGVRLTAADDGEWAAWTLAARVLLNLDEAIVKE